MQDVWVLGQVAGFHSDPILLDTECLSAQQWTDFGEWFIRCARGYTVGFSVGSQTLNPSVKYSHNCFGDS